MLFFVLFLFFFVALVSCHRPFLSGNTLEPPAIPTAQATIFRLQ